ncbi:phytoene desaturase family protein [Amycolatopsis magusensis]|uniref:Pyridine nucleotide-disulfide oxidoreductase domain-containing protein 2 n=1 Tax=Amycolatopsis magusensis TaxID=882444 RepID=A0ABS4PRP7_9PSEU|nr:NAD(P)/FAD-dependent oxidoreductase [Amycolatopsis magusensis]MBP2182089.1 phytoene dehydrogenase-like protein [Amycolatopsis magusensis]
MTADAVVIGAGPNGLVAANLLTDAGWEVVVLEAAAEPGGAVRTAEVIEPGFRHDLFSAFYPLGSASPVLSALDLDIRWSHAPEVLAHVLPDDRSVLLSRDIDKTAASVATFAEADGDAWRSEYENFREIRDHLLAALFTPFPPVRSGLKLAARMGAADLLRFGRLATMPVRTYGARRFQGEGGQLLLAGNALHTDLGPGQAGSAIFGWLLGMLGQDLGFPVPEGGAGSLTAALARRLEARGGQVVCDRPVTRVLTSGGAAQGVVDATGQTTKARRAVLATVPAPVLYGKLLDPDVLPARLHGDLENFVWDDATFKVDWALSKPIPWSAEDARGAGTVHLGADLTGLADYSADLAAGRVPEHPFLLLGQMTTADATRSPAGTETAWAYTHVPRGRSWDADELRRFADRMEAVVERHAPGFRSAIRGRYIQGPADLERANPSLVEGSTNAGTAAVHQQLFLRPVPGLGRADTPVDRLYLAGASAHPGGAVHGGPGANAARAALARNRRVGGTVYNGLIRGLNRALYR